MRLADTLSCWTKRIAVKNTCAGFLALARNDKERVLGTTRKRVLGMTGKKVLGIARQKRACHDHVHAMTESMRHDITLSCWTKCSAVEASIVDSSLRSVWQGKSVHAMTKSVRHDITLVMLNEVKHPCAGFLATLGMTKLSSQWQEKSAWHDNKSELEMTKKCENVRAWDIMTKDKCKNKTA